MIQLLNLTLRIFDEGHRLEFMNNVVKYFGLNIIEVNYVDLISSYGKQIQKTY